MLPTVSVVIPVFQDVARLLLCLRALEHQTYHSSLYEIIVVDNGGNEGIQSQIKSPVKYLFHPIPGSYGARNYGAEAAGGEVLAFTDADCLPEADWIEQAVKRLIAGPEKLIVAGGIKVFREEKKHPAGVCELYDSLISLNQPRLVHHYSYGATANLFVKKSFFREVGPFDARLKSYGDFEWCRRAQALGGELVLCEEACVRHPTRQSFFELLARTKRVAGGKYDYLSTRATNSRRNASWSGFGRQLSYLFHLLSSSKFDSNMARIKFLILTWILALISVGEQFRLKLGGVSQR